MESQENGMGQKEEGKANGLNDTELYGGTGMQKITRNAIRCKFCGDVIESETVHDFKFCSYKTIAVDGGHERLRRCFKNSPGRFRGFERYGKS